MGLLNVIKGAYPSLQQIDRTLPVADNQTGIVRGSLVYEDNGTFKIATSSQAGSVNAGVITPGAYLYYALMAQDDLVAEMAGNFGNGRITGLACSMPMEIETDQYTGAVAVGDYLTVGDGGKLVTITENAGNTVYGIVTAAPAVRWHNAAEAVAGRRTGNKVSVIRLSTVFIPGVPTSA